MNWILHIWRKPYEIAAAAWVVHRGVLFGTPMPTPEFTVVHAYETTMLRRASAFGNRIESHFGDEDRIYARWVDAGIARSARTANADDKVALVRIDAAADRIFDESAARAIITPCTMAAPGIFGDYVYPTSGQYGWVPLR